MPTAADLDLRSLDINDGDLAEALAVNPEEWRAELALIDEWFATIGDTLPAALHDELHGLRQGLGDASTRSIPTRVSAAKQ